MSDSIVSPRSVRSENSPLSSPGHAQEHAEGPRGPFAPAAGSDRAGDAGREAERTEASGRPDRRDPAVGPQRQRAAAQQGDGLHMTPPTISCEPFDLLTVVITVSQTPLN